MALTAYNDSADEGGDDADDDVDSEFDPEPAKTDNDKIG